MRLAFTLAPLLELPATPELMAARVWIRYEREQAQRRKAATQFGADEAVGDNCPQPQEQEPKRTRDAIQERAGKDYEDFKDSIRRHGQRGPAVVASGVLLDGRNRVRACIDLGISPKTIGFAEDMRIEDWIWIHNHDRRHLNPGQLAIVGTEFEEYERERAKERVIAAQNNETGRAALTISSGLLGEPKTTRKALAEKAGVGKGFSASERVAITEALRTHQGPGGDRSHNCANGDPISTDDAAKKAGFSGEREFRRAKNVVEHGSPERESPESDPTQAAEYKTLPGPSGRLEPGGWRHRNLFLVKQEKTSLPGTAGGLA